MAIHPFIHPYMDAVLAIWSLGSFAASLRPEAERERSGARGWLWLWGCVTGNRPGPQPVRKLGVCVCVTLNGHVLLR